MTLEEAIASLIENAGNNGRGYAEITTWQELAEAVDQEMLFTEERLRNLSDIASAAAEHNEDGFM
ncbi:hypothetical protein [Pantoea agglomerans]|uniref:hypothetical protein n=1 Tax=Enterobacter agglomerans TaxID=549 RepID=UPI0032088055